jgi:hypothetical protein
MAKWPKLAGLRYFVASLFRGFVAVNFVAGQPNWLVADNALFSWPKLFRGLRE